MDYNDSALDFLNHFQAETVRHPRDVIADGPLETLFFNEMLEIARHKLWLIAKMPEKPGKPLLDFFADRK